MLGPKRLLAKTVVFVVPIGKSLGANLPVPRIHSVHVSLSFGCFRTCVHWLLTTKKVYYGFFSWQHCLSWHLQSFWAQTPWLHSGPRGKLPTSQGCSLEFHPKARLAERYPSDPYFFHFFDKIVVDMFKLLCKLVFLALTTRHFGPRDASCLVPKPGSLKRDPDNPWCLCVCLCVDVSQYPIMGTTWTK